MFKMFEKRPSFGPAKVGTTMYMQCVLQPGDGTEVHTTAWMRGAPNVTPEKLEALEKLVTQASEMIIGQMREMGFEPHVSRTTRKARPEETIEHEVKPRRIIKP